MFITVRDKFTFGRLLLFSLPSIIMMIFTSIYGVVDGFFVSNFVGKTPFAAVNYIMPVLMILGAVGFMFGTGGSAIVASTMGAWDGEKAKRRFSLIVYATVACGIVLGAVGIAVLPYVAAALSAASILLCKKKYGY